jgi:hypothetical protein
LKKGRVNTISFEENISEAILYWKERCVLEVSGVKMD